MLTVLSFMISWNFLKMQLCFDALRNIASYKCILITLLCDEVMFRLLILNSRYVLVEMLPFLFRRLGVGTYLIGHMPGSQHIQIKKTTQAERFAVWVVSCIQFAIATVKQHSCIRHLIADFIKIKGCQYHWGSEEFCILFLCSICAICYLDLAW